MQAHTQMCTYKHTHTHTHRCPHLLDPPLSAIYHSKLSPTIITHTHIHTHTQPGTINTIMTTAHTSSPLPTPCCVPRHGHYRLQYTLSSTHDLEDIHCQVTNSTLTLACRQCIAGLVHTTTGIAAVQRSQINYIYTHYIDKLVFSFI